MSPAKQPKKAAKRTLTIEFSGICTLMWDAKAGTAAVHMVDLGSAGFQRHYAALGLLVSEDMPRGVKGPDADAAVSLPGADRDMGLWNLAGTDVTIVGETGKLTVDVAKVDVTKKPTKKATSINWLPNIGVLADSTKASAICPTACVVHIPGGHIAATAAGDARRVQFVDGGTLVGSPRYCLPRFTATIPFTDEIAIKIDRQRVIRFTDSMSVMMSNTCVCGLGLDSPVNHFFGHYEVVRAKRRPSVKPAGPQPKVPLWPEFCFGGFVQV